jgi:ribonuclease BN (tRNA processing enzyme)
MKVTFLGTNGWYDTATGNTTSVLVEMPGQYIILDAGFGFYKVKDLIKEDKPVLLFISHFHLDHIIGLHTLPLFKIAQGLDIYLPKGGKRLLGSILKRPFTSPPALLPTRIRVHEISKDMRLGFGFEMARLRHSVPCYGYRFETDGVSIAYCTDTGICANLKRITKGVDLLIAECSMRPADKSLNLFHITPETAARVAREASAKKLALIHFDPGKYPTFTERDAAEDAAKAIFADSIASRDGLVIII